MGWAINWNLRPVNRSLVQHLYTVFTLFLILTVLGSLLIYYLRPPLFWGLIFQGTLFILLHSLFLFSLLRRWDSPIAQILRVAERYAQGDLEPTLRIQNPYELRVLGETLTWMARELKNRIDTIALQRNELEGILKGMSEAVFLLDGEDRIKQMNHAAETLARLPARECVGKRLYEVIPERGLHQLILSIRRSEDIQEHTLEFPGEGKNRYLQAHVSLLPSSKDGESNLLIVLNDVTRIKQLEEMRKDFVANVSHELRTPITSILGFVETLKEGALQDPERSVRFLSIIENQTLRLHALIEDLLSLSRLEQAETTIRKEWVSLREIFTEVETLHRSKADAKQILLRFVIQPGAKEAVYVNSLLIIQALINLIDNAIKYSDPGSEVIVTAYSIGRDLYFSVQDTGPGIPKEEQSRIFERFYRIDKTRSRSLGGTGLGLAIVKHIALAHGGSVSLESNPGEGSTFILRIPDTSSPETTSMS